MSEAKQELDAAIKDLRSAIRRVSRDRPLLNGLTEKQQQSVSRRVSRLDDELREVYANYSLPDDFGIPVPPMSPAFVTPLARLMMPGFAGGLPTLRREDKLPSIDLSLLAKLQSGESYHVTQRMPDMMEVITGWRAWGVTSEKGWRLTALGTQHTWQPKQAVSATCDKGGVFGGLMGHSKPQHPAPNWNCHCGVWAFKSLDLLLPALEKYEVKVLGQVSLWGRVIETENGYRAEKAYPSELWLLSPELEELGLIYDVPVRCVK